jgi:beta-1,4-mannosyltransferase
MAFHVAVVVLGDLGRSPRMQYHAKSLAQMAGVRRVSQVGYVGEDVMVDTSPAASSSSTSTSSHRKKLVERRIAPWEFAALRRVPLLHAVLKGVGLLVQVFACLLLLPRYDVVIIQNPPCLPALVAASVLSAVNGSVVVVDWHNLGFAMFQERYGPDHVLVRVARGLEHAAARFLAHEHVCVSQALQRWLQDHFGVGATVLYDRPARLFAPPDDDTTDGATALVRQRHELLVRLGFTDAALFPTLQLAAEAVPSASSSSSSSFTCQTLKTAGSDGSDANNAVYTRRVDGARLVVSATSWTADEDFSVLLDALLLLNEHLLLSHAPTPSHKDAGAPPRVLVVVTGKGPLRAAFEDRVRELTAAGRLQRVAVRTAWLASADYALLLRCADLGVCLHTSTSGLDLPMKVLDMFGSGLPVCAVRFPTLTELVRHGDNGLIFETPADLKDQLVDLLVADRDGRALAAMRTAARGIGTWDANWDAVMRPRVQACLDRRAHRADHTVVAAIALSTLVAVVVMEVFTRWVLRPVLNLGL